jgi:hypothetical protein
MVLIVFGPFALSYLPLPLPLFIQSWFIYIAFIKYNTICPNTYVIRAYSITKIYASTLTSLVAYVTQHMAHNIIN